MSEGPNLRVIARNTFLDIVSDAARPAAAIVRPRSAPPSGRGAHDEADSAQLLRLTDIFFGAQRTIGAAIAAKRQAPQDSSADTASPTTASASSLADMGSVIFDDPATPVGSVPGRPPAESFFEQAAPEPDLDTRLADDFALAQRPSVGSAGHATGKCRPCIYVRRPAGCVQGASCSFCHVMDEHLEEARRPCKGKRERIKKVVALVEARVAADPDILTSGRFFLPTFVEVNPKLRAQVLAQLAQVAADAYRGAGSRASLSSKPM
mmetsp:Transcript_107319/g.300525  ORF Transcript_107319/g.300525 Transcript_107319/m.300525 type:complete len:265 (+) Transcript_107319:67-861(+)